MDDDLFNVPDNDEEMLDGNEDEEIEDENNNDQFDMSDNEDQGEDDEMEEEDDNEDEDDQEENGIEEEEEDDDEEDNEEEDNGENGEGDEDMEDEEKFVDSKEHLSDSNVSGEPEGNKENPKPILTDDKEDDENDQKRKQDADNEDTPEDEHESISPTILREKIREKAAIATDLDIIPSVAIPYTSECHTIAFSDGPKWILTGGQDGFIRKYDFIASVEGKSPLTMAQRHSLVDTVTKAGVISSYWENEQPLTKKEAMKANPKLKLSDFSSGSANYEPKVNPVYSLDVERNGYWCLSGLLSGGISLYTMRHNEGNINHYFMHQKRNGKPNGGHSDAVSVIKLNTEQNKFLSGSWDKTIKEWDLNTGNIIQTYSGSSGQVSSIQYRPSGLTDLSLSFEDESTDTETKPNMTATEENKSDVDSLFGDSENEAEYDAEQKMLEAEDKAPSKISVNNSKIVNKTYSNDKIFMNSNMDGTINVWDARTSNPVIKFGVPEDTPPWCMSSMWSNCGDYIFAGRRNSTVEQFSLKMPHKKSYSGTKNTIVPNVAKVLQFPKISGPVSAISTMPNSDYLLCGSNDNIRLYNLKLYKDLSYGSTSNTRKPATPFTIIPGHHGGILSSLYVDDTGRFMVSASGNRGWGHSVYTDAVLIYEIEFET